MFDEPIMRETSSSGNNRQKFVATITWLLASSSMVLFLTLVSLGLHVRLGLGHWPKPMGESYRTPAFDQHFYIVEVCALFALFIAPPLWLIFLCSQELRFQRRSFPWQAAFYLFGWIVILAAAVFDPNEFTAWLLD